MEDGRAIEGGEEEDGQLQRVFVSDRLARVEWNRYEGRELSDLYDKLYLGV